MGHENESGFVILKPFVSKLFLYAIMLVIASNSWKLFKENQETYIEYVELMRAPLITDIKLMNKSQSCPSGYETLWKQFFPKTISGCLCDYDILNSEQCKLMNKTAGIKECETNKNLSTVFRTNAKPTKSEDKFRNLNAYDDRKCTVCYSEIPALNEEIEIKDFYPDYKICYQVDTLQNTFTYLKSSTIECDAENVCNDFFCKKDNNHNNKCPITIIKKNLGTGYPIYFSKDYREFNNFDGNNHGEINLPAINMGISLEGVCNSDTYRFVSNYPLIDSNVCQVSQSFTTIDSSKVGTLLKSNSIETKIYQSLPYFNDYLNEEWWNLSYGTAMSKGTINCFINYENIHLSNAVLIKQNSTKSNYHSSKEKFAELMHTFNQMENIAKFQWQVQLTMLIINVFITAVEVIWVLIKLFKVCGFKCKTLSFIFSYEGYLSFFIDIFIAIVGIITYVSLKSYLHHLEEILEIDCLGEHTRGNLNNFKVATDVVADKGFEIFVIVMTKITLMLIGVIHACTVKRGTITFRECEHLVFERQPPHEEHGHGGDNHNNHGNNKKHDPEDADPGKSPHH